MANENFQVGWSTFVVDSLLSPCDAMGLERGRKREIQGRILRIPKVKGNGKGRTAKNTRSKLKEAFQGGSDLDCQSMEKERKTVTNVLWI